MWSMTKNNGTWNQICMERRWESSGTLYKYTPRGFSRQRFTNNFDRNARDLCLLHGLRLHPRWEATHTSEAQTSLLPTSNIHRALVVGWWCFIWGAIIASYCICRQHATRVCGQRFCCDDVARRRCFPVKMYTFLPLQKYHLARLKPIDCSQDNWEWRQNS